MKPSSFLSLAAATFIFAGCATDDAPDSGIPAKASTGEKTPAGKVDFVKDVKPILRDSCVMCHNKATMPNRHSFETRELAMKGDNKGPIIVPGKPEESRFMIAIVVPDVHESAMPPVSTRITKEEVATLNQWITEGAKWPSGRTGRITPPMIPRE